jgi:GT2 family glycosyltransferase
MVAHAVRPQVGAVGALLVYPNGLVQHAGVTMGIGGYAGHAHRFFHPDAPGYMGRIACQHYVAAVTAACLVVERAKFEAVGGFDAEAFAVAYNDVDLCLKLRAAGYENLYTPFARLTHKESASRVRDFAPERAEAYARECAALVARWGDVIADDPYYHPALTRADETFSLD